jgi:biopolymer transport protein ExbD
MKRQPAGQYPDPRSQLDDVDEVIARARMRSSAATIVPFSVRYQQRRRGFGGVMLLNMTPMLDVLFLLLFFFMAAASRFLGSEGMLPAKLPAQRAAVAAEIPRTPIRIRFQQSKANPDDCRVTIDQLNESPGVPIAELVTALKKIRESQPGFDANTPVHLMAGDDVRWDHVVNAYNAALAAQYEKVFFAAAK